MFWAGKKWPGLYTAAAKFAEVWNVLPAVVGSTFYPRLVEWKTRDAVGYEQRMQFMFDALTALGLLVALGAGLFGPMIVRLVYGPKYESAGLILVVLGMAAPFSFSGTARAQYLLLERVTIYHTFAAITGIIVNFSVAWAMVPRLGPVGAATGSLAGFFVSAYVTSWMAPALRPCARLQTRALLTPWLRLIKERKLTK
jgi:O-antigen/teichoic acid export membrane protein